MKTLYYIRSIVGIYYISIKSVLVKVYYDIISFDEKLLIYELYSSIIVILLVWWT